MLKRYVWIERKPSGKAHVLGEDGMTLCHAENGIAKPLDGFGDAIPDGRVICSMCRNVARQIEYDDMPEDVRAERSRSSQTNRTARQQKIHSKKQRRKERVKKRVVSDKFYDSYEWRALRYKALQICGATCMCCGRSRRDGVVMNVDHIKSRKRFPELALVLSNLQVLCAVCNHGKGNWDETDWREPHVRVLMGEMAAE